MATDNENRRHEHIQEMQRLYKQRPFSDQELAKLLGTGRENIFRIRKLMNEQMGIPIEPDPNKRGRYYIPKEFTISHIPLNRIEAAQLYLAGRRLQQQTRTSQRPVVSALEKLAYALNKPLAEQMVRAAEVVLDQEQDPQQEAVFATLVECWLEGIPVRITHRKLHGEARTYRVHPYQLEPSVWGDGVYLIGHSEWHGKLATFKLARIEKAVKGTGIFTIPEDFDIHELLNHAWGVWHADDAPDTVTLRFSAYVTPRVRETIWHPQQTVSVHDDGSSEWSAPVAEPREMLPWIRGWGADCKILGPDWLMERIEDTAYRLARMYGVTASNQDLGTRLLRCWGKTDHDDQMFHPALYHMIDVAHIAQQLLSSAASPRWRHILSHTLGADETSLIEWLPWLVALHDLGKIAVPFQAQNAKQMARMEAEGFDFGRYSPKMSQDLHHTIVGRIAATSIAQRLPTILRQAFTEMISGHHGVYQEDNRRHRRDFAVLQEPDEWKLLRQKAVELLEGIFLLKEPDPWPEPTNVSAAIVALNGFVILCDWLGSDTSYFTPNPQIDLLGYVVRSRHRATNCVKGAGFFTSTASLAPTKFTDLFPDRPQARPLQLAIDNIPDQVLQSPCLAILEAPTGEGKTEAALTLARRIAAMRGTDEIYVALPTTATSNAMFGRIQEHLRDRLRLPPDLVKLIHGQDFLVEDDLRLQPMSNGESEEHPSLIWFAPKKRALLAPFAVGTVDQAELSALNVRHNALRLIGLAGKVVILDEVHAYDTYMTTIIEQMLRWLAALGTSVILLSATLPSARRKALAEAFAGSNKALSPLSDAYPSLLVVGENDFYADNPEAAQPNRLIAVRHLHFTEEAWAEKAHWLVDAVKEGGCVAWITNTVHRAQQIYRHLLAVVPGDVDCDLLHARFPLEDRQAIEDRILSKYGPSERDPKRKGIVVGTQVLEQSLDLDFDVMVSDLAPIDLILQRGGRLHRHPWRNVRPKLHPIPVLYVQSELADTELRVRSDRFYTEYLLHKTWEAMRECYQFNLPQDYRTLVESVYDSTPPPADSPLYEMWKKRQAQNTFYEDEARLRLSGEPDPVEPFWQANRNLFQEDEDSSAWIVAQTRLGQESITVIPLERINSNTGRLLPTGDVIPLDQKASRAEQLRLMRRSVRLSHPTIVGALKRAEVERPALFTKSTLLKHCHPLWLDNNSIHCNHGGRIITVQLDKDLGLVFEKGEQKRE